MITTINPIVDKRWDAFITSHPDSTIFHHSAWARVLQDRYRCDPAYYVLENEDGEISAAAPFFRLKSLLTGKRLVCLPGSEFCFPLVYSEGDLMELLTRAREDVNGGGFSYFEVRGWGNLGAPEQFGLEAHPYFLNHVVNLDGDMEAVRTRMDRNGRYNLRYAMKSPVTIRMGQSEDDLKEFYRLATATRRRLNLLPQPYRFFQSVYHHIVLPGHGYFLLAELSGKVIAANMYFCFKDTVTHEFNAADKDYFEFRPNYLLIWKAMEHACEGLYRYYNFGRTQPENQALANFKRHWGSEELTLPYYYYPAVQGISSVRQNSLMYRTNAIVNKWLPEFVLKFAGEVIYRHVG